MAHDIVPHVATDLNVPQLLAIAEMVKGSTVTDAATKAGVDRSTVHRWLADPVFAATLNLAKQEALDALRAEIRSGASEAVRVVRYLMNHQGAGNTVRLRAALALIDRAGGGQPETIGPTDPESVEAANSKDIFSQLLGKLTSGS